MVGHHNINVFYNTVGLQKYCADILFAFFGGGVLNIVTFKTFYRSFYDMKGQNSILKIHQWFDSIDRLEFLSFISFLQYQ